MIAMKSNVILGPTLRDVQALGLHGQRIDLATAFYTGRALDSLEISAKEVRVLCRLDLQSIDEWSRGYIAPDALLKKMDALTEAGTDVTLFASAKAHAKAYTGSLGALVGSANLTLRGFGGGLEMVVSAQGIKAANLVRASLDLYQKRLTRIDIEDLRDYVRKNLKEVRKRQKKCPNLEDRLPAISRDDISNALGSYQSYLTWLTRQPGEGAKEILARAQGKNNLQGHIHRNFYGLRQFFVAYAELQTRFSALDESHYKLSRDPVTEARVADFVSNHAADEDDFSLSTWKTYLPRECGGRAERHGGTIGNLNRMLPLVARYLDSLRKHG